MLLPLKLPWWLTQGLDICWILPSQLMIAGAAITSHFISGHEIILYIWRINLSSYYNAILMHALEKSVDRYKLHHYGLTS